MTKTTQPQTITISALIAQRQAQLNKTDEQLAQELGFERPNIVAMIKQGAMKLPVQKIEALAAALSLDAPDLLRHMMSEYMPDVLAAVDQMLFPTTLTQNEAKLIQTFRHLTKGKDIDPVVVDGNAIVALMVA